MKSIPVIVLLVLFQWWTIDLFAQEHEPVSLKDLILKKYDLNHDGVLFGIEKDGAVTFLKKADKDSNGEITEEEALVAIGALKRTASPMRQAESDKALTTNQDAISVKNKFIRSSKKYYDMGNYVQAYFSAQMAFKIADEKIGSFHVEAVPYLTKIAEKLIKINRYAEAESIYNLVYTIYKQDPEGINPRLVVPLIRLGDINVIREKYSDAEQFFKNALARLVQIPGENNLGQLICLTGLGDCYMAQKRFPEAQVLYKRALTISEQATTKDHTGLIMSISCLGSFYEYRGNLLEARPLYIRALELDEQLLGSDHSHLVMHLDTLATLSLRQNFVSQAESHYKRALSINEKAYGPNHYLVGKSLTNLSVIYNLQGREWEAKPLEQKVVKIHKLYTKEKGGTHTESVGLFEDMHRSINSRQIKRKNEPFNKDKILLERQKIIETCILGWKDRPVLYKTLRYESVQKWIESGTPPVK